MNRRVVVWRHGRTAWNLAGRVQGQSDIALDEVGRQQAKDAAARLASLGPDRIISSDLQRAFHTARELEAVSGVPVEQDPRFRELNFGAREGLTWKEAWAQMPEAMQAWIDGAEHLVPDSETHRQAGDRFAAALTDVLGDLHAGQTLVVVAHGAVIRTGVCAFLGIPEAQWKMFGGLANCHWAVLEEWRHGDHSAWRLTEWNTGTLPEPVLSDDDTASPEAELT